MLKEIIDRWPLVRQIRGGTDGTGPEAMSDQTRRLLPRHEGAQIARSICPYCAVGCGQLDPRAPIRCGFELDRLPADPREWGRCGKSLGAGFECR